MDLERKIELLEKFFDSSITRKMDDELNTNYHCYEETTADGYTVHVLKPTRDHDVSVSQNVYYYHYDLGHQIIELFEYYNTSIYVEEFLYDDLDLDNELFHLFEEYVDEIIDKLDVDITEEELNDLKQEYGIEEETESA